MLEPYPNPRGPSGGKTQTNQPLRLTSADNQPVNGSAEYSLSSGKLTVTIRLGNPNSNRIAACLYEGGREVHSLNDVVNGTSMTTLDGVTSRPDNDWCVKVHLGKAMSDRQREYAKRR